MTQIIQDKLKDLGIKREEPVGKKMGSDLYFHKQYIYEILGELPARKYLSQLPNDFDYEIVRYNPKKSTVSFIQCENFDTENEPVVGDAINIDFSNPIHPKVNKTTAAKDNPLIYHHKWLFVKDDYQGFNVLNTQSRSLLWKNKLESNKSKGIDVQNISSFIGRKNFWDKWCENNFINPFLHYHQDNSDTITQSTTSAKTSRNQTPATFKILEQYFQEQMKNCTILDIGCGAFKERLEETIHKSFPDRSIAYHGIDPFNQTTEDNLREIKKCANQQSDIVLLNNVLNVINYQEDFDSLVHIMSQCENALKDDGFLCMTIYEGEFKKGEKEELGDKFKGVQSRDGWQNRMKAKEYLPLIQPFFPHLEIKGNIVVASKTIPEKPIFGEKFVIQSEHSQQLTKKKSLKI